MDKIIYSIVVGSWIISPIALSIMIVKKLFRIQIDMNDVLIIAAASFIPISIVHGYSISNNMYFTAVILILLRFYDGEQIFPKYLSLILALVSASLAIYLK